MDFKFEIEQMANMVSEMQDAFRAIQQPRSDFALEHFVVGQHDTEPRQYAQCVLEMQIKYRAIRRHLLSKIRIETEIRELREAEGNGNNKIPVELQLKCIDLEEIEDALLGAFREFVALYRIFRGMKRYTYEELQQAETEYWKKRLLRQARQEQSAYGRIGVGNIEALEQIGISYVPTNSLSIESMKQIENGD